MTTRPEGDPISASWRARARGCPVTTVDLAPLAEDEAQELAAHYPELPPETIDGVHRSAPTGYPLFLDQLLRAASAGHDLLPGSVRSLVLARADSLVRRRIISALQAAAVLGHRAALTALRRMIGDDDVRSDAADSTTALVRFDGADVEFAHALFRDAIYESTLKSQRRELHRTAAEWYAHGDQALHADHLAAADDERATAAYLEASLAEQAALRFERALALRQQGERARARAGHAAQEQPAARRAVAAARPHARCADRLSRSARLRDRSERPRQRLDRHRLGVAHHGSARGSARSARTRGERARRRRGPARRVRASHTLRGNLCFPLGRLDACLQAHEQAHRYALQAQSHARDRARARAVSAMRTISAAAW